MKLKVVLSGIMIFCAGVYCSEFLIPKKTAKRTISNEQLIHRLEGLMRVWSRVLTKVGVVQEYSINTIAALLEHDKTHPLVIRKSPRQAFADRVTSLTDLFSRLDQELHAFCSFLKQMKQETRADSVQNKI